MYIIPFLIRTGATATIVHLNRNTGRPSCSVGAHATIMVGQLLTPSRWQIALSPLAIPHATKEPTAR